ncbi:MAG: MFS transporter [Desulfovibrio sp.]|nr:MFS transporter [Desulfovibrio sp.]
MVEAILSIFGRARFVGPQKPPKRWDKPGYQPQKLLSRDFILLFFMAMCSNSYIAVYYCFEQWMEGLRIDATWRGILLSSLFAMILVFRPVTSMFMLRFGKLWPMLLSLIAATSVMTLYPFVSASGAIPMILCLRLIQGVALAIYSACTVGVLVECIPPGQSARGFALFSLTMLLPYSIIPALSEVLLPLVGGEARLFAWTAILGIPSLIMVLLLEKRLRKPEITPAEAIGLTREKLLFSITHSGLAFVYLACLSFSSTTVLAIFFMKGLCGLTGAHPAHFFTAYSVTIILVRVFGSHRMDTLPRHKYTIICSLVLAACMAGFAYGSSAYFIPIACVYGLGLGFLYPLLAAAVYDRSTPETRSINSNVMMATFDASGMLAPVLGGFVIAEGFGYRGVFVTAAFTVGLCGLCMAIDKVRLVKKPREGK